MTEINFRIFATDLYGSLADEARDGQYSAVSMKKYG